MRYNAVLHGSPTAWDRDRGHWKGGGSSSPTTTTQTVQNFSPEEAANRAAVQNQAQALYQQTAGTIASSPYPGSQVIPFSPETQQAQDFVKNFANTTAPAYNQNMADATTFGLGDVMYADSNPYLQSAISNAIAPITASYTDPGGVFSQIRTDSNTNGDYGRSSRQGIAEGIAAGKYAGAVGATASDMANKGYQSGLDTFAKTLALAPQTEQSMLLPGQLLSGIGVQTENMAQANEDYAANMRDWNLNASWLPLQNWANLVYGGSNPGTTSTSSSTGTGSRSNTGLGILGGAMQGYQLGALGGMGAPGAVAGAILGGLFS